MEIGIFELLAGFGVLLYAAYLYFTSTFDYWKKLGVPGPEPVPFFGNLKDAVLGRRHNAEIFKEMYDQYRNESLIGIFLQRRPALLLKDPEIIKDILIKDFNIWADRGLPMIEEVEPLSAHLVNLQPDRWRPLRSKLSPVFTSGKLKDMFYLISECGQMFEEYIDKIAEKGETVEIRDLTAKFTTDSIGACAFGLNMNAIGDQDSEFREIGRDMFETNFMNNTRRLLRDMSPTLYKLLKPIVYNAKMNNFFIGLMRDTFEYRSKNNVYKHDFVDTLMELKKHPEKLKNMEFNDTFLTAQALVFFAAGFETSSTTMSNAMLELALNPEVQKKLRLEINEEIERNDGKITYDGIKNMKYLDKVFKETLRKYPPAVALVRKSSQEYTIAGTKFTLPKGFRVFIPVYAIHHDENIYPEPQKFDPERFSHEMEEARHSMSFLPFGDGPRNCIGARFAKIQSKLGIIKMIQNYRVEVSEKMEVPYRINPRALILSPVGGILLKIKKL